MELIYIIVALILVYYFLRPASKEELKRFKDNNNWSNMGF